MLCTRCGVISCSFQDRRLTRSGIRQRFPRAGGLSALCDFPRAAVHLRIAPAISARFSPSESIYTSGGCFSVSQIRGTFPAGWCGPVVLPAHLSPAPGQLRPASRICAAGCPLPDPAPAVARFFLYADFSAIPPGFPGLCFLPDLPAEFFPVLIPDAARLKAPALFRSVMSWQAEALRCGMLSDGRGPSVSPYPTQKTCFCVL